LQLKFNLCWENNYLNPTKEIHLPHICFSSFIYINPNFFHESSLLMVQFSYYYLFNWHVMTIGDLGFSEIINVVDSFVWRTTISTSMSVFVSWKTRKFVRMILFYALYIYIKVKLKYLIVFNNLGILLKYSSRPLGCACACVWNIFSPFHHVIYRGKLISIHKTIGSMRFVNM